PCENKAPNNLRVISKSAALIMAPRHHDHVARLGLTNRLGTKLDEVEQDRDHDDREHVAARKGEGGSDEDGLQADHNREKLWHRTPRFFVFGQRSVSLLIRIADLLCCRDNPLAPVGLVRISLNDLCVLRGNPWTFLARLESWSAWWRPVPFQPSPV